MEIGLWEVFILEVVLPLEEDHILRADVAIVIIAQDLVQNGHHLAFIPVLLSTPSVLDHIMQSCLTSMVPQKEGIRQSEAALEVGCIPAAEILEFVEEVCHPGALERMSLRDEQLVAVLLAVEVVDSRAWLCCALDVLHLLLEGLECHYLILI